MKMLPSAMLAMERTDVLGGDSVEVSLVSINHFGVEDPYEPFFSLYFVAVNPIPRAFWEGKPEGLGERLPVLSGYRRRVHGYSNWGPGIVGHGFHEGGLHILLIYGLMTGLVFRYADELLRRQSDNPILLGVFAAASGQIVALSRGEFGLFIVLIIGAILTGVVVNFVGRLFLGTGRVYLTPEEEEMWRFNQSPPQMPAHQENVPSRL